MTPSRWQFQPYSGWELCLLNILRSMFATHFAYTAFLTKKNTPFYVQDFMFLIGNSPASLPLPKYSCHPSRPKGSELPQCGGLIPWAPQPLVDQVWISLYGDESTLLQSSSLLVSIYLHSPLNLNKKCKAQIPRAKGAQWFHPVSWSIGHNVHR